MGAPAREPVIITAIDYHTAGEPFRIVNGGIGPIPGETMLEKRRYALEHLDDVRRLLVCEPRGHADMYGCFLTDPVDEGADLGVLFFHNAGYSTACGHGTIALATAALETGMLPVVEPETTLALDVPSGRLPVVASVTDGRVERVRFTNVPSFVHAEGLEVGTTRGTVATDLAFGGAFYAFVEAASLGLEVTPAHVNDFIALGREIKAAVESECEVVHPLESELRDVYGVIFWEQTGRGLVLRQRNVTVFADGEVDRSPCGSGTSARLALLDKDGSLPRGETLVHESIIGTEFEACVVGDAEVGEYPAVVTEVSGSAHLTGFHQFVLRPDDPLGTGFLLR
jgi:proline racemase